MEVTEVGPKRIWISVARFVNCQTLGDVEYNFSPGLNVIRGKNNAGKSVFMKILKLAACPGYYSNDEQEALISHGAEYAMGIYLFSDGSCGAVKIFPKRCTYHFTEKHGEIPFDSDTKPHPNFVRNLALLVDSDESYIANILDLDQSLLLVNSSHRSNHNLAKLLVDHPELRRLIEATTTKMEAQKANLKVLDDLVINLDYRINKNGFVDTMMLESRISNMNAGIEIYEDLLSSYREATQIDFSSLDDRDFGMLLSLCDLYEEGSNFIEAIASLHDDAIDPSLLPLLGIYEELYESYDLLVDTPLVDDISGEIKAASEIVEAFSLVESLKFIEFDDSILALLDVYEELRLAQEYAISMVNLIIGLGDLTVELGELREFINTQGVRVACGVYGEVQHIDGQCIPIHTGRT